MADISIWGGDVRLCNGIVDYIDDMKSRKVTLTWRKIRDALEFEIHHQEMHPELRYLNWSDRRLALVGLWRRNLIRNDELVDSELAYP